MTPAVEVRPAQAEWLVREWHDYLAQFVQADGRVMDPHRDGITTSEGQTYGMLRAAWIGDESSFFKLYRWTVDNLQGGDPGRLPAWKWGRREDGTWGVLDPMPAADADQWYAWALLLGERQFQRSDLRPVASRLLEQIWVQEVQVQGQQHLLLPGPWARNQPSLRMNPSYFLPFAWRAFAKVDPAHPWMMLLKDAYTFLGSLPNGLPPDWVEDGKAAAPFGYEAFRLIWSLAAEARWFREPRARAELRRYAPLWEAWRARQVPAFAGETRPYAGLQGVMLPALAPMGLSGEADLYLMMLQQREQTGSWGSPGDYYAANWVWFGVALWSGVARPPEVE